MDALLGTLKSLPDIATNPLAIVAYLVVVGAWLLSYLRAARFKMLLKHISSLPEVDRKTVLATEMNTVIPAAITAEEWLRGKRQFYMMIAYVLTLLAVVLLLTLGYLHRGGLSIDGVGVKTGWLGVAGPARAETVVAAVDGFQKRADSTPHKFRFDLVLRNSSDKPVTVTSMTVTFDPNERGFLSELIEVSNTYVVMLDSSGSGTVSDRTGDAAARAWYPNPDGQVLIVKTPLQQVLRPLSTDRFIVEVRFPDTFRFKGPMRTAKLSLTWNGKETAETSVSFGP